MDQDLDQNFGKEKKFEQTTRVWNLDRNFEMYYFYIKENFEKKKNFENTTFTGRERKGRWRNHFQKGFAKDVA